MFWVYILQSEKSGRYYIGSSANVEDRLRRHNAGRNFSTKHGIPWKIVHQESFASKNDAYRREMQIKRYRGGEAFKRLLK